MLARNETLPSTFTFKNGRKISRLGFGAMRLTGPGIWGAPADRDECIRTLRRLPELGIDFIDTADSYGPDISEQLVREALHPYANMFVATKAGLARTGPDAWRPLGRPEYLIQQAYRSAQTLGVDHIDLWQLHRIDPRVPRDEQFDAIRHLLHAGLIRLAGLSQVSIEDIEAARAYFPVATVQNRYNLLDRESENILDYCTENGIGFIPWFPLASGDLARADSPLSVIARAHKATPGQIALAWMLKRSSVMLPIPGTSKVAHLEQNAAAGKLVLTDDEFDRLERLAS